MIGVVIVVSGGGEGPGEGAGKGLEVVRNNQFHGEGGTRRSISGPRTLIHSAAEMVYKCLLSLFSSDHSLSLFSDRFFA